MPKEANARLKINKLLEDAGWILIDTDENQANVKVEKHIKDDETETSEFADYILNDPQNFPLCIIEAKREEIHPLDAKEQARNYANKINCRFVILSNGDIHYFWDLENGNPVHIFDFPTQENLIERKNFKPNLVSLSDEIVGEDYIALSQNPDFRSDPRWMDETKRRQYLFDEGLKLLRRYQLDAVEALQNASRTGQNRFLFEMATGTGKTLTASAIIKMYLKTGNARRILFLVDRLELEEQAEGAFIKYLQKDYRTVIFKKHTDDWNHADIVVSTVQSLSNEEKYKKIFTPNDFDLVISDEAHRSISGKNRNIFEYFLGHKIGLTATPKDYLKSIDVDELDPRELEKRNLLSTYKTFGCESGEPTYRYGLLEGVKDGFLIAPTVADCRTEISTKLLSNEGYTVITTAEEGEQEVNFTHKDFEKKFFSDETNRKFVEVFMTNALRDPFSSEIGKTIVFAVSQKHAMKLTEIFNEYANKVYPGVYSSDFAVQVTSKVMNAQNFTILFRNNALSGKSLVLDEYETSKTRVCVTVGMMTTGYDCPDLLNICLMRPIFSPSDFVQIKGRGTRTHTFEYKRRLDGETIVKDDSKTSFKIFDYFANFEYFQEKYDYDQVLELPKEPTMESKKTGGGTGTRGGYDNTRVDPLAKYLESYSDPETSKIDNQMFDALKQQKIDRQNKILDEFKKFTKEELIPITLTTDALNLFVTYLTDIEARNLIEQGQIGQLSPRVEFYEALKRLGKNNIFVIIEYIKTREILSKINF